MKGAPIVTSLSSERPGQPTIPFVGLSEALVLAAIRSSGVPLQRVRPALEVLSRDLGVQHALASHRLYSDGAEVLFDYAESSSDPDAPLVAAAGSGPQPTEGVLRGRRAVPPAH